MRGMHKRSSHRMRLTSLTATSVVFAWACVLLPACATIHRHNYGVRSLEIQCTTLMDEEAIKVCLTTQARERTGFLLGPTVAPECNVAPFDATRLPVALWSWPWTEWPIYDDAVFDRDISRINRWYRARGFYNERVVAVTRTPDDPAQKIDLTVKVEEGAPTLTEHIEINGIQALDAKLHRRVQAAIGLKVSERFDETSYDDSKRAIIDVVRDAAYAQANVEGKVLIDAKRRRARVTFDVQLGRRFRFGQVFVEGQGSLPKTPIRGAAQIEQGTPYSLSTLADAKRAIYELGPFASVELEERPRPADGEVDILIKVVPGRLMRFSVGLGMQAGVDPTLTPVDTPGYSENVWDLHLLAKVEHRNFLGGMRRVSVEERPRLIFKGPFPTTPGTTELGNLLIFQFKQPAFIEARTTLSATVRFDRGPDPYGGDYSRSDFLAGLGPERSFFNGKLRLAATINLNVFVPTQKAPPTTNTTPSDMTPSDMAEPVVIQANYYPNYFATYMQYTAVVDLRNDPREPRRGAYFGLTVQTSGYLLPSDWNYVRITPDLRGYVPLPLGMVLAGRAHFGFMGITSSRIHVSADDPFGYVQRLHDLGPLRQRLRGGGSNSVRGYLPNTLGDVFQLDNRLDSGGLGQWEASLELRAPITASFGAVLFADVGDVSADKTHLYRFEYPQTTLGFGLRYKTLIGPIRLDAGFAPPNLQVVGGEANDHRSRVAYNAQGEPLDGFPQSLFFGLPGAISFTVGEAF
jgi:outer membrane protein assembly factor BamA